MTNLGLNLQSAVFGTGAPKDYDIPAILRLAISKIARSVVIADADRDDCPIIFANPAFLQLTGYSLEEVIGRNCRFLNGPDTSPETRAQIRECIRTRQVFSGLILNYRKDGTAFWNEFNLTPLEDPQLGRYFIGVQTDVTEKRDLEIRLRESQRMEAIGKLSGGIAHDFNNIVALVLGNAELIAGSVEKNSIAAEAAADIIEAADGASKLVARMLHYARGEDGGRQSVAVNTVVRDLVNMISRTIGDAVRIETDLSEAVGQVSVDRSQFETALLNLVLNARDAIPSGGSIRITTRKRPNAGPLLGTAVTIAVSDTGTGMEADVAARAFEPFFTTKQGGRGNGLGLAMVYNFAKSSGGDVTIQSEVGKGTTVTILLPIEGAETSSKKKTRVRQTVLIVEDDAKLRKVVAQHVAKAGYAAEEVATAEEAIAKIEDGLVPALVLSDIRLGSGMTGLELAEHLSQAKPGLPLLLMTGFADEVDAKSDTVQNFTVLRKPFRATKLIAEIRRLTGAGEQKATASRA